MYIQYLNSLIPVCTPIASRSRSRSAGRDAVEHNFGVSKQTLLHGSYSDYIKEYTARSTSKGVGSSSTQVHYHCALTSISSLSPLYLPPFHLSILPSCSPFHFCLPPPLFLPPPLPAGSNECCSCGLTVQEGIDTGSWGTGCSVKGESGPFSDKASMTTLSPSYSNNRWTLMRIKRR